MTDHAAISWIAASALIPYPEALETMQARVASIREGAAEEMVWLVEHPPLYTAGSSAKPDELEQPDRFPTYHAGRGGHWTYHGPGQRVAYVMLDLTKPHGSVRARDVRNYVRGLEEWLIRTVAAFGITAERREGRVGIWVVDPRTKDESKIGAIGVRITRWISWHGVSLNVAPDLSHFGGIVPCGIREHGVTSLRALGSGASMTEVDRALRQAWSDVFE